MQLMLSFNFVVLFGLALFLIREERRFRSLSRRIAETKEDLTSIVQQLRSPLSNLRKYNEFLRSKEFGRLSFSQLEALSNAQLSLEESLVLLDRLLARSHLDENEVALRPTSLNLRKVINGAIEAVTASLKSKKHTLNVKGKDTIKIFGDPILLHGILDELLVNALRYTPDGGKITVAIAETKTSFSVAISDTGIGISAAEQLYIFDKFFRGERARAMHAGNGLGLAFAKQFTSKLRGTIRFTSKEGKGSTFTLSIPKSMR